MRLEKKTVDLPVKLNHKELVERSKQLAKTYGRLKAHADHESQVKTGLKTDRLSIEGEIERLVQIVSSEQEDRPIDVEIIADFGKGIATHTRMDNGETIRERALTDAERAKQQKEMFPAVKRTPKESPKAGASA